MDKFIYNALSMLYGPGLIQDVNDFMSKIVNGTRDFFKQNGAASVALEMFIAIGVTLMILFFYIDVLKKTSKEMMTLERLILAFIKLVLGAVILLYLREIVDSLMKLCLGIYDVAASKPLKDTGTSLTFFGSNVFPEWTYKDPVTGKTIEQIFHKNYKGLHGIDEALALLLPWLACYLARFASYFIATSTAIMLIAQLIFMPIAAAQCFDDGERNKGLKYIQKFAATALTFAVIIGFLYAASLLQGAVAGSFLDIENNAITAENLDKLFDAGFIANTVIQLSAVGGILKAQSLANDIVGV